MERRWWVLWVRMPLYVCMAPSLNLELIFMSHFSSVPSSGPGVRPEPGVEMLC
jgi:hypothetical protein